MMIATNKKSMMALGGPSNDITFFEELNKFVLQKLFTRIRDSKE